jgi:hypothetical protein
MPDEYWKVRETKGGSFIVAGIEGEFLATGEENYRVVNDRDYAAAFAQRVNADAAAHYANYLNFRPEPPVVKLPGITGMEWSIQRDAVSMSPWVNVETVKLTRREVIAWHRASLAALDPGHE